jgi:hypothetical protein
MLLSCAPDPCQVDSAVLPVGSQDRAVFYSVREDFTRLGK